MSIQLISFNTLTNSCEELTHWKTPWCWEGLGAGGEGYDRGWDSWMASPTQWTWVLVDSGSWWWTGRSGVLRFMGSQRVGHDWATELNWTEDDTNFIWEDWYSSNNVYFHKTLLHFLYNVLFYSIFKELKFGWPLPGCETRHNKGISDQQKRKIKNR